MHPADWYAEHDVDLRLASPSPPSTGPGHRRHLGSGGDAALPYDKLLLATGASPRRLDFPGSDRDEVLYLRTLGRLRPAARGVPAGPRVVVAGAGWIGLETTAAARSYGCPVTVLEPQPGALHDQLGPELGAVFADLHRAHGVEFRFGERAESSSAPAWSSPRRGAEVPADLFVVGIGAAPNDRLAARGGPGGLQRRADRRGPAHLRRRTSSPPATSRTRSTRCSAAGSGSSTGPTR